MHYLHGYFAAYAPTPSSSSCPVRHGLLLAAILGLALKVHTQDYVLDHLPIKDQLELFDIRVPTQTAAKAPVFTQRTSPLPGSQNCDDSRCSTDVSQNESMHVASDDEAEAVILDEAYLASDPDLYFAKMQLEERVKHALAYQFSFDSPLDYVRRFFEGTFAPEQRVAGPIKLW